MTRLEIMKANKQAYARLTEAIKGMTGLEKAVAETLTTEWITSKKFLGGLSDSRAQKLLEKLERMGYSMEEAMAEFDKQMNRF